MRNITIAAVAALLAAGTTVVRAPSAYADDEDQAGAEQAVQQAYNQAQARCTPRTAPGVSVDQLERVLPAQLRCGRHP
jgi:hypothetical protein